MQNIIMTKNSVRLTQVSGDTQATDINLVLIPGGPGMGSEYLKAMVPSIQKNYSVWLVDLPNNGSNKMPDEIDYTEWPIYLEDIFDHLDNVIMLGHSYGGMAILLNPNLDKLAKGFILLDTLPESIFHPGQESILTEDRIVKALTIYRQAPSDDTLKHLIIDVADYYFDSSKLDNGIQMFSDISYSHQAYDIIGSTVVPYYQAQYIPSIPTLIIGGERDIATPIEYFQNDERFKVDNIKQVIIENANHFPWIDNFEGTVQPIIAFNETIEEYILL